MTQAQTIAAGPPEFTSDYMILDVMKGRAKLASFLKKSGPVRVLIEAEITEPYGSNDGTSIEFNCNVLSVRAVLMEENNV